jgi:N-methylhydantoinase A
MTLDKAAAEAAVRRNIAEPLKLDLVGAAHGICHLAAMNMTDPQRHGGTRTRPAWFSLICFGGGGTLRRASAE